MKNRIRPSHRRRQGAYTLFEIMLVLAIISLLLGSAIYGLVGFLDEAKVQRVNADIRTIETELRVYEMQNLTVPTTAQGLEALVTKPTTEPLPRRWSQLAKELPMDPWNHPYKYLAPGKKNPTGYDLYSLGPDGTESGDDQPQSQDKK